MLGKGNSAHSFFFFPRFQFLTHAVACRLWGSWESCWSRYVALLCARPYQSRILRQEIPQEVTRPGLPRSYYKGQEKSQFYVSEAQRCVDEVVYSTALSAHRTPSLPSLPSQQDLPPPEQPPTSMPRSSESSNPLESNEAASRGGRNAWSTAGTDGETATPNVPPQLPTVSGGQGLGHFLDPSDVSSTQFSLDSIESKDASTTATSNSASQPYSVDDMGVITQTQQKQGPAGASTVLGGVTAAGGPRMRGGVGGGQFATFPVKGTGRGGGLGRGVTQRGDTSPNRLGSLHNKGPSFEVEVSQALLEKTRQSYATQDPPGPPGLQQESKSSSPSLNPPEVFKGSQSPSSSPVHPGLGTPVRNSPQDPPSNEAPTHDVEPRKPNDPIVRSLAEPSEDSRGGHHRDASEDSVDLAYTMDSDEPHNERISRHVRFAGMSPVEEEMVKGEPSPPGFQVDSGQFSGSMVDASHFTETFPW
jgi:hypothetical protein